MQMQSQLTWELQRVLRSSPIRFTMRLRTHPGERRHDDAVRKIDVSHSIRCEKRLIRHHRNSCMD